MTRYLQDLLTEQAERSPGTIAIQLNDETLSYGELDAWSTRLAHALRRHGCTEGDRICTLMPKSPRAIATLLGIYKAGCIFVPLDWESPASRLCSIVADSDPTMILAAGPVSGLLNELLTLPGCRHSIALALLDEDLVDQISPDLNSAFTLQDVKNCSMDPIELLSPPDVAHILFTSGSTGAPKGVMVTHQSVLAFIDWAVKYFNIDNTDRVSGHSPLHFDLSIFDIFGAFAAGAELHLTPDNFKIRPDLLVAWIRDQRLTQWFSVPAAFTYVAKFDALKAVKLPALKRIIWCGEVLPVPSLVYWMQHVPQASFTNLYGPTETTIASSYYKVLECPTDQITEIPIGRACDGETLRVLNKDMQPCRIGEIGDIYIAGVGLSSGYWKNEEASRQAFIIDPANGERCYRTGDLGRLGPDHEVYFVGRTDTQVKSRGFRIELGEIEAALNAIDILRESAIVALTSSNFDGVTLCCSYVARGNNPLSPVVLRAALSRALPWYMIPSRWQQHDTLPRNGSGKIDRPQLKEHWLTSKNTPAAEVPHV